MAKTKEMIAVTVDIELAEKLDRMTEETMVPKSALVNKLLKDFFQSEKKSDKKEGNK